MELAILKTKVLNGKLASSYQLIMENSFKFDTDNAVQLLACLCKVCSDNLTTPESLDKDEVCKLALHVCRFIKKPSEKSIEDYLRSIFYVVKLLLVQDNFDKTIELKEALIPPFLPIQLIDKHQKLYRSIWVIIYNKIVSSTQIIDHLLHLSVILIEMMDRLDDKECLQNLYRFWLNLERSQVDWELLNKSCREILANLTITQNRFEIILKIYSTNFSNLLNCNKVDVILEFHKYFVQLFKKFGNTEELALLQELLGIYKFFINNDTEALQSCHKSLSILHKNYNSNNLHIVCDVLTSNILLVTKLCEKNPQNYWKLIENRLYYKFLNDLSLIIAQFPYKCTDCGITTRMYDAITVSLTILHLSVLFLSKSECDFGQELLAYLKEILNFIVVLKSNNCTTWKRAWSDCSQLIYSIGKILLDKNNDFSLKFFKQFIHNTIELEGYNSRMFTSNHCTCCLVEIAKIYYNHKKDYEKSLTIIAFNILISPEHRDALFMHWVRYKANCRGLNVLNCDKIQELTLVKILEKYKHVIYFYDSNFQLTHDQKVELLRLELKAYRDYWKSKVPMMATFRQLHQIDNINSLVDLFIDIWGNCDVDIHEDFAKLIPTIIRKYESVDYDRINLAQLYYLYQKYYLKNAVLKITYDMNKTVIFKSEEANNDPDEECDIVPSYENLKLNRYNKIMKQLDRALDILNDLIQTNDSIDYNRVYCLLKKIGFEYRLHSNLIQSIYTWYSALKIANFKGNDLEILESTSFLIELIKQPEIIQELINKADRIVDNLDTNRNLTEIITYYLSKSLCYYHSNIEEAYRIYCDKIWRFSESFDGNFLMKTRILLLYNKFLISPCKFVIIGHPDLSNLHRIYKDAIQYYNTNNKGDISYELSIFFEVTEQIALLYHNLQMPRELRCYCKEIVVLTQRLLLPYRTLLLLYYLAYADLISTRFDDFKVKLTGLSDILCLQNKLTPTKSQQLQQQISKEIDRLTVEFNEIMLDVPAQTTLKLDSPNSPNLPIESFKLPPFFYHQEDCDCFQCVSVEFLEFVLKKTHLDLMLNIYENNTKIARDYCCGALKIFEFIGNKQGNLRKFTKLPDYLLPNIVDLNLKTYGSILVEYANLCLRTNEIDKARRINQNLFVQLSNYQFNDDFLISAILIQKFNISSLSTVINRNNNNVKVDLLTVEPNDDCPKTPETRQNPVKLTPIKFTPAISPLPLPKKPIRTIQFDLDSDDAVDNDNNHHGETLKKQIYNELFPGETPAPSKNCSKYKTRSAVKKQNSKKNIEEANGISTNPEVFPLTTPYKTRSTVRKQNCQKTDEPNQESSNNTDSNLISMSPEAYTPNLKGKAKTNLDNRTKLLTERLRSNKKENINTDNTGEQTKTVRKTTRKLRYN